MCPNEAVPVLDLKGVGFDGLRIHDELTPLSDILQRLAYNTPLVLPKLEQGLKAAEDILTNPSLSPPDTVWPHQSFIDDPITVRSVLADTRGLFDRAANLAASTAPISADLPKVLTASIDNLIPSLIDCEPFSSWKDFP